MQSVSIPDNNYCVYCHINKTNGKRYVGITCRDPETRWRNGTGYSYNGHFHASIKKYGWDGFEHIILHSGLSKKDACQYESDYIKRWNLRDGNFGYNLTNGGEGCRGRILSEETKAKISASHIGIGKSVPLSEEHKQKISEALRGKPHPHKIVKKRKPFTEEQKKHVSDAHKIPVIMYDRDGVPIKVFQSCREGAMYVGLKTAGDINKCCKGRRKTAGGYLWGYVA